MICGFLVLLRGLPGAGKTTFGKMYSTQLAMAGIPVAGPFEADQYFDNAETGHYEFDASKLGAAHAQCQQKTLEAFHRNTKFIVVSNTFTTEREVNPYLEMAKKFGYDVISLVVENRHGEESIHNVPEEAMDRMRSRFSVSL